MSKDSNHLAGDSNQLMIAKFLNFENQISNFHMLKEICQLQLAELTNHDLLNHESIQIRISRHTIARPANHELNHQNWRFVQALS